MKIKAIALANRQNRKKNTMVWKVATNLISKYELEKNSDLISTKKTTIDLIKLFMCKSPPKRTSPCS